MTLLASALVAVTGVAPAAAYNGGVTKTAPVPLPITPPGAISADNTNAPNGSSGTGFTSLHTTFWSFTPGWSAQLSICTYAPSRDTTLELWTGANAATLVAANDDAGISYGSPYNLNSGVTFNATAGQTYVVGYGGYQSNQGPASLRIVAGNGANACSATGVTSALTTAAASVTETTATLTGQVLPVGNSTAVTFRYGTSPTLAGSPTTVTAAQSPVSGTSAVAVSAAISGLSPGTTYYAQAVAADGVTTSSGAIVSFTTLTFLTPVAVASAATAIGPNAARLNGTVNPSASDATVAFVYGRQSNLSDGVQVGGFPGTIAAGSGSTPVSAALSALLPSTTYYFQVSATNTAGTTTSPIASFATSAAQPPAVGSLESVDVTATSATVRGMVLANGASATAHFQYSRQADLSGAITVDATPNLVQGGAANTQVVAGLDELDPATRYYYRLRASNGVGGVQSTAIGTFVTGFEKPLVQTTIADTTLGEVTLNGNAVPNGIATTVKFRMGLQPNLSDAKDYAVTPADIGSGTTPVAFSRRITGLTNNTRYYYQAVATNSLGQSFGPINRVVTPFQTSPTQKNLIPIQQSADITWPVEYVFTITGAPGGSVSGGTGGKAGVVSGRVQADHTGLYLRHGMTSNSANPSVAPADQYGGAGRAIGGGATALFSGVGNRPVLAVAGGGGGAAGSSCYGGDGGLPATAASGCGKSVADSAKGATDSGPGAGGRGLLVSSGQNGSGPLVTAAAPGRNGGAAGSTSTYGGGGGGSGYFGGGGGAAGTSGLLFTTGGGAGGGGSSFAAPEVKLATFGSSPASTGSFTSVFFRIATQSLPDATAGLSFKTNVTAVNGIAPITWEVMSGQLPAGLTLSEDGIVSGVPTTPGTSQFRVLARSTTTGGVWEQDLSLTVGQAPVNIGTSVLGGGTPGVGYTATLAAAGGVTPYTWATVAGALPAGLSLNPTTGVISGTPTTEGTANFTVRVTDGNGKTDTATLSIVIATPTITTASVPNGTVGTGYSSTVEAAGGDAPRTFSVAAGQLPAGLSLNPATGAITGTPTTAGTSTFLVEVKDNSARVGSASFTITIADALLVTTASLPSGTIGGRSYTATLEATGGVAPTSWAVTSGSLPAGATLDGATGVISGELSAAGTATFTVTVTDARGATATKELSITTFAALDITTTSLDGATVGVGYAQTVASTGGRSPITWQLRGGSLPDGLAIAPETGAVAGTPTAVGSWTFMVQATDANGATSDREFTIDVLTPVSITTVALGGGSPGFGYSQTLQASGGQPGYVWVVDSGTLPDGLSLNPATGEIDGTPSTTETQAVTFRATDAAGVTATRTLTIVIDTPVITNATVGDATVGQPYSQTFVALGGDSPYSFAVVSGSLPDGLALDPETGELSGTPTATGTSAFAVTVTDSNASPRTSPPASFSITVHEPVALTTASVPAGTEGLAYSAQLEATGGAPALAWSIDSGALPGGLSLDADTGEISGTPSAAGSFTFTVKVDDVNGSFDTREFTVEIAPALSITTETLSGTTVGADSYQVAIEVDGGTAPLAWSVGDPEALPPGLFLDSTSGVIAGTPLAAGTFTLDILVTDALGATATRSYQLVVAPAPVILTEQLPAATSGIAYDTAVQAEGGVPDLTWSIQSGTLPDGVSLDPETGELTGTPTGSGTYAVVLAVTDANDSTASQAYTIVVAGAVSIVTTSLGGGTLGLAYSQQVEVSGGTQPLQWSVSAGTLPGGLELDASTGAITGTPDALGTYAFTIRVEDALGGFATHEFEVVIATPSITTGDLAGATADVAYSQTFQAAGGTTPYSWQILSGTLPSGLALDGSTGAIDGTPTAAGSYSFTIQVTDSQARTATATRTVVVADPLTITTASLAGSTVGAAYAQAVATSGGTLPLTWSVLSGALPPGVTLNPATGAVTGTATTAGTYAVTIKVVDAAGSQATRGYGIVVATAPAITTAFLAEATESRGYSQQVAATGGTSPLTWSVAAGQLPDGMALDPDTGVISGSTTETGSHTFTVRAVDAHGIGAARQYTLIVNPPIEIVTTSLRGATQYANYQEPVVVDGGTAPVDWSLDSGTLPTGLTLDPATGWLRGATSQTGTFGFTVQVTDAAGSTATRALSLTVAALPTINGSSALSSTVSASFGLTLTSSGGQAPLVWALQTGTLPPGLTWDAQTHTISGTPTTAGTYNFGISLTDANGFRTIRGYSFLVRPAPQILTSSLPDGTVDAIYSRPVQVTGGTGPLIWSNPAGSLPPGLSLSGSNGQITGKPTQTGTFTFTVRVTDANGVVANADLTIVVVSPPAISTASLPTATATASYSTTLAGSGGRAPLTWSLAAGSLPAGLALNPATGEISGVATTPGVHAVTVRLRDVNGSAVTRSYTLTVVPAVSIATTQLGGGTPDVAYSQQLAAAGGQAPYLWAYIGGDLPDGLELDPWTGIISGTPIEVQTTTFTVEVTDAADAVSTRSFTIVVATPTIGNGELPVGTQDLAYETQLVADGGTEPYLWEIIDGDLPPGLVLDPATGTISGDPSAAGTYTFTAQVTDDDGRPATAELTIVIAEPVAITTDSLPGTTDGALYSQQLASSGGAAPLNWEVSDGALPGGVTLDPASGLLSGTATGIGSYSFTIQVTDANGGQDSAVYPVDVVGPPAITTDTLPGTTETKGYSASIQASGGQAPLQWQVVSGSLPAGLSLDPDSGELAGAPTESGLFSFLVVATDVNGVAGSKEFELQVYPAPTILIEELPGGTVDAPYSEIVAADGGQEPLQWAVSSGALPDGLALDTGTGELGGTPGTAGSYSFEVTVADANGVSVAREFTVVVAGAPVITTTEVSDTTITANYSQPLTATDGQAPLAWSISGGLLPDGLSLDADTGVISGSPNETGDFTFVARVTDANGISAEQELSLTVAAAPSIETETLPGSTVGAGYSQTLTGTGGLSPLVWSVPDGDLPDGLVLDPDTGVLAGTATAAGTFTFTVRLADASGVHDDVEFVTVVVGAPSVDAQALPEASEGVGYSQTLTATGGHAPLVWEVLDGALPDGVALSQGGQLSGTATQPGTYTFTVKVTDSNGISDTEEFTLTVNPSVEITTESMPGATVTAAYSLALAATGGTAPLSWTFVDGALPSGLALDGATGVVSGMPDTAGSATITFEVTDAYGAVFDREFTVVVAAVPAVTTTELPEATVGSDYEVALTASGGTAPLSWAVSDGALPAGLSLDPDTGVISGDPTQGGTFTFTVEVTDVNGVSATAELQIVVSDAPVITTDSLPQGTVGGTYFGDVEVDGGRAPLEWSVTDGSLPGGIELDPATGGLTGKATEAGTFAFTVRVQDSNGADVSKQLSIVVLTAPQITTTSLPGATVGRSYAQTLQLTGGVAPMAWGVNTGSLPDGLSLDPPTGVISGTPTGPGEVTVVIEVVDANGVSDTKELTIVVAAQVAITTTSLPATTAGMSYSRSVAVTGGTAPLAWSISDGSLPPGIELDAATGELSGSATTAGDYGFTISAGDANGSDDARAFTISVSDELVIGTETLPPGTVTAGYTHAHSVSGGLSPLSWAVTTGSLPDGIALDPDTGVLSGTPTAAGTFTFTLTVTDDNGATSSIEQQIVIAAVPSIGIPGLPGATVDSGYRQTVTVDGGTDPLAWSVVDGALPDGLSLDPDTGVISGTPTQTGTYSVTIEIVDANGVTSQRQLTLVVADRVEITTGQLPDGVANESYQQSIQTRGGTAPFSWQVIDGQLPAGLVLDSANGRISGVPAAAGSGNFTVRVTDANDGIDDQQLSIAVAPPRVAKLGLEFVDLPDDFVIGQKVRITLEANAAAAALATRAGMPGVSGVAQVYVNDARRCTVRIVNGRGSCLVKITSAGKQRFRASFQGSVAGYSGEANANAVATVRATKVSLTKAKLSVVQGCRVNLRASGLTTNPRAAVQLQVKQGGRWVTLSSTSSNGARRWVSSVAVPGNRVVIRAKSQGHTSSKLTVTFKGKKPRAC